jgi:hypothetical protein
MNRSAPSRREPAVVATMLAAMLALTLLPSGGASAQAPNAAQPRHYALESAAGLRLVNVTAESVTHQGKQGLRVSFSKEARERTERKAHEVAVVEGIEFSSGVIEAEIAGAVEPGAPPNARGFVGIAFRVQDDMRTFDLFLLRPTNGRADDQVRRNHAVQYSSHPDWMFDRLRKEAPEKYESYVDLVPDAWTKVKIEVRGERARLYVHGQEQPTLIVNDLKTGANAKGAIALWIDVGTVAHFRNLTITP